MKRFHVLDKIIIATPTPTTEVWATIIGEEFQNGTTYFKVEEEDGEVSWIEEQWVYAFNKGGKK